MLDVTPGLIPCAVQRYNGTTGLGKVERKRERANESVKTYLSIGLASAIQIALGHLPEWPAAGSSSWAYLLEISWLRSRPWVQPTGRQPGEPG